MQPLKILAFVIGALPIAAFLLTLFLTDGAPLRPLSPGEESGPAVATPALPRAKLERQDGVAAAGHFGAETSDIEHWGAVNAAPKQLAVPRPMVNTEQDAQLFILLFGGPQPDEVITP